MGAKDLGARMGASLPLWWLWWWPDSRREDVARPEQLTLRDGTRAWVRPILASDRELHRESYENLSAHSKHQRFLSAVPSMTDPLLDQLVEGVDGVDHVAFYLFLEGQQTPYPAATGRIIRDPEHPEVADIGLMVRDEFQGRGIATALLQTLIAHRPAGVTHLLSLVSDSNDTSLHLMRRTGPHEITALGSGMLEVRVSLGDDDLRGIDHVPAEDPPARWRRDLLDRVRDESR